MAEASTPVADKESIRRSVFVIWSYNVVSIDMVLTSI